jgi:hypothetical protein
MWIKASDRLPSEMGHYLVIWENSCSRDFPEICSKFDVLFFCQSKWWAPVSVEFPVTHWMPLPSLPTAETAEGANLQPLTHAAENGEAPLPAGA